MSRFRDNRVFRRRGSRLHPQPPSSRARVSLLARYLAGELSVMADPSSIHAAGGKVIKFTGARNLTHLAKQDSDKVKTESRKTGISLELTCWPRLATGWTVRGSNPGGGEIFRTHPYRPWGPRSLLYNGYRVSFLGIKRCGRGLNHPPPSSAEVKERVELYLYSASGPSRSVLRRNLPFPLFFY